jgi:hypothetical protein
VTQIREYRTADAQAVVDLSLRAWTPVFISWNASSAGNSSPACTGSGALPVARYVKAL